MPLKRKSTVTPIYTVTQLLVGLQLDGHLDEVTLPDWAIGTSVDELFKVVRLLGDGEWLRYVHPDKGVYEACDKWLSDFIEGSPVPTPSEAKQAAGADEGETRSFGVKGMFGALFGSGHRRSAKGSSRDDE